MGMSQKLPVIDFELVEDISKINKDFRKNINEESDEVYLLETHAHFPEKLHELHGDLPFLRKRIKI